MMCCHKFMNICCTGTKEAGCLDKLPSGCSCSAECVRTSTNLIIHTETCHTTKDGLCTILSIGKGCWIAIYWRAWLFQILCLLGVTNVDRCTQRSKDSNCHWTSAPTKCRIWKVAFALLCIEAWVFQCKPDCSWWNSVTWLSKDGW